MHCNRFSQANVVGVNNNAHQLQRCRALTQQQGLSSICSYLQADFHKIPVEDGTFDAAFHCEAMCHAGNRVEVFKEALRVIKPGGYFAGYDWIITVCNTTGNPSTVNIE